MRVTITRKLPIPAPFPPVASCRTGGIAPIFGSFGDGGVKRVELPIGKTGSPWCLLKELRADSEGDPQPSFHSEKPFFVQATGY